MNLDLAAELVSALRSSSGRAALAEAIAPVVAAEMKRALAEQHERLDPYWQIVGVKPDTARKAIKRDKALAALAVTTRGRTLLFKRSAVLAYLSAKGGAR